MKGKTPMAQLKGGRRPRTNEPPTNPKDIAALDRVPMWSLPAIGAVEGAQATGIGIEKYGAYNWRAKPISLLEYLGAIERHVAALKDGEWFTADKVSPPLTHLGCINANTAIILDASQCGMLIDDRPLIPGHSGTTLEEFKHDRIKQRASAQGGARSRRGKAAGIS